LPARITEADGKALNTVNFVLMGGGAIKANRARTSRSPAFPFALAAQTL